MIKLKYAAFVLATFAMCGAGAQTLYRVVAPDGKVTFTDRAPTQANDRTTTERKAMPAPSRGDFSAKPRGAGIEKLETATLMAATFLEAVERANRYCSLTFPATANDYRRAHDGWKSRNAEYLDILARVLKEYATQSPELRRQVSAKLVHIDKELRLGDKSVSANYCKVFLDDMSTSRNDIANSAAAGPLQDYAAGKRRN